MTIDDIRKKHEEQKNLMALKLPLGIVPTGLSISDVDALLAALDAERGKVDRALTEVKAGIEEYKDMSSDWWSHIIDARQILIGEPENGRTNLTAGEHDQ